MSVSAAFSALRLLHSASSHMNFRRSRLYCMCVWICVGWKCYKATFVTNSLGVVSFDHIGGSFQKSEQENSHMSSRKRGYLVSSGEEGVGCLVQVRGLASIYVTEHPMEDFLI